MAVLDIYPRDHLVIDNISYDMNHEKTVEIIMDYDEEGNETGRRCVRYVTGINCSSMKPEDVLDEFMAVKEQFGKADKIMHYHAYQSFAPGEATAEQAHEIGVELAKSLWGDRFQVLVSTHLNTDCIHNHFRINSVSFLEKERKFDNSFSQIRYSRRISDEICKAYGLSVIRGNGHMGKKYEDWLRKNRGEKTVREFIMEDIDMAIQNSISMGEFWHELDALGYEVKRGKYVAISPPGHINSNGNRAYFRLHGFKDARYSEQGIEARVRENYRANYGFPVRRYSKRRSKMSISFKRKLPYYEAMYYKYMYQTGRLKRKPVRSAAVLRKDNMLLRDYEQQIRYITKNNIKDSSDLDRLFEAKVNKASSLLEQRQNLRNRIRRKGADTERDRALISKLTSEIVEIRKEINTMKKIRIKTEQIECTYAQLRAGKKGENKNVFRDASGRCIRESDRQGTRTGGENIRNSRRGRS